MKHVSNVHTDCQVGSASCLPISRGVFAFSAPLLWSYTASDEELLPPFMRPAQSHTAPGKQGTEQLG